MIDSQQGQTKCSPDSNQGQSKTWYDFLRHQIKYLSIPLQRETTCSSNQHQGQAKCSSDVLQDQTRNRLINTNEKKDELGQNEEKTTKGQHSE